MSNALPDPTKYGLDMDKLRSPKDFYGIPLIVAAWAKIADAVKNGAEKVKTTSQKVRESLVKSKSKANVAAQGLAADMIDEIETLFTLHVTEHPLVVLHLREFFETMIRRCDNAAEFIVQNELRAMKAKKTALPKGNDVSAQLNDLERIGNNAVFTARMNDADTNGYGGVWTFLVNAAKTEELDEDAQKKLSEEELLAYQTLRQYSSILRWSEKANDWTLNVRRPKGTKTPSTSGKTAGRQKILFGSSIRWNVDGQELPEGTTPYAVAQLISSVPGDVNYDDILTMVSQSNNAKKDVAAGSSVTFKHDGHVIVVSNKAAAGSTIVEDVEDNDEDEDNEDEDNE